MRCRASPWLERIVGRWRRPQKVDGRCEKGRIQVYVDLKEKFGVEEDRSISAQILSNDSLIVVHVSFPLHPGKHARWFMQQVPGPGTPLYGSGGKHLIPHFLGATGYDPRQRLAVKFPRGKILPGTVYRPFAALHTAR